MSWINENTLKEIKWVEREILKMYDKYQDLEIVEDKAKSLIENTIYWSDVVYGQKEYISGYIKRNMDEFYNSLKDKYGVVKLYEEYYIDSEMEKELDRLIEELELEYNEEIDCYCLYVSEEVDIINKMACELNYDIVDSCNMLTYYEEKLYKEYEEEEKKIDIFMNCIRDIEKYTRVTDRYLCYTLGSLRMLYEEAEKAYYTDSDMFCDFDIDCMVAIETLVEKLGVDLDTDCFTLSVECEKLNSKGI